MQLITCQNCWLSSTKRTLASLYNYKFCLSQFSLKELSFSIKALERKLFPIKVRNNNKSAPSLNNYTYYPVVSTFSTDGRHPKRTHSIFYLPLLIDLVLGLHFLCFSYSLVVSFICCRGKNQAELG